MMIKATAILFTLLLFLSVSMVARTKRAFVIGFGKHKNVNWVKINSDKDVPYVQRMLNNARYKVVMCVDSSTSKGIGFICRNTDRNRKKDFYVNSVRQMK